MTHMSHIETGNTKLSLPVLVSIADVLCVRTDESLFETQPDRESSFQELKALLESCSTQQICIITDIIKATKMVLEKHTGD